MLAALRSWQISAIAFVAFALALILVRTPRSTVGLGVAIALTVAVRILLEVRAHGRGGEFAQLGRIGKPLGLLALAVAAATILIRMVVQSAHPLLAVFDAAFAAVLLIALDSIVRRILIGKGAR